jgi:type I restriction enzyme M protein
MLSPVVSHLQGINLEKTELDTKGVAFERFMDGFFKGNFGQYFTPREVIQFAVEMFPPNAHDRVLDPACGSGGFLLHALDHIRREAGAQFPDWETDSDEKLKHYKYWHDFAQSQLFGIEINDEIARVAKMNMILHDDGHTNVIGEDALEQYERFDVIKPGFSKNSFDLVLTNPPFGASVAFNEKPHLPELFPELAESEDAKGNRKPRKNQKTEILFLERIHQFLREGGRAAVVLPDGILTNSSLAYVREYLLRAFRLRAVISLPQMAFAHYGAGVKSSIVFLEKRDAGEVPRDDEAIFMAAPENIGYDATGRKTWKLIEREDHADGSWTEIMRCDLFDARIRYEIKGGEIFEGPREVDPGSGLLGELQKFEAEPEPFFV